jgi:hypothetical protein
VEVDVAQYEPTVLAILPAPVQSISITAVDQVRKGGLVEVALELVGPTLGDTHAFRVNVTGPDGEKVQVLTKTLAAPKGRTTWDMPIALSDPAGEYTLFVKDVATGISAEHRFLVSN